MSRQRQKSMRRMFNDYTSTGDYKNFPEPTTDYRSLYQKMLLGSKPTHTEKFVENSQIKELIYQAIEEHDYDFLVSVAELPSIDINELLKYVILLSIDDTNLLRYLDNKSDNVAQAFKNPENMTIAVKTAIRANKDHQR